MKKLAIGVFGVLLMGAIVSAQSPARLYTQPPVPTPETLDRLNLKLAWRTYLPTEGRRDGIFSVQIPERVQKPGELVLVQTRSAAVMAFGRLPQLMHHVVVQIQVKSVLRMLLHE